MFVYLIYVFPIYYGFHIDALSVKLNQNGPVVLGAIIQLTAKVETDAFDSFSNGFVFTWEDNAIPAHSYKVHGESRISKWNITYDRKQYTAGNYIVQATVCDTLMHLDVRCASARVMIEITGDLNGEILLSQNNTILESSYVSNLKEVEHQISLKDSDLEYLQMSNFSTRTYWFLNCTYYGMTSDLRFRYNYSKDADSSLSVRTVIIAYNETDNTNETLSGISEIPWPNNICNNSFIPEDSGRFYGFFHRIVKPRRPLQIIKVNGTNWLKNGDLLNLTLTCKGSPPYFHCIKFIQGEYNATGNETCKHNVETSGCNINVIHYYSVGEKHTVLFIVRNEVSHTVTGVGITKYIAKKHAPLSVIIVPISCCAVAVVLIIFGVAYYIQSKNRYTIEVADFDFSTNQDTEYKSFKERLGEAMSAAFTRVPMEEGEESPSWSPSRNIHNKPTLLENSDSESASLK